MNNPANAGLLYNINMRTKTLFVIVIIVVVTGTVFYFKNQLKKSAPQNDSAGLIVGKNAIYVAEQAPGQNIVVSVVHLGSPGFVVIHEDASGAPGKILGASGLLPAGETKNLSVALSRAATNNETVYAMLHFDNGDDKFNTADDKPAIDLIGNEPVMMVVVMSGDAVLPRAVNP